MQPADNPNEEEKLLAEKHQLRSDALLEKHKAEVLASELNNESEDFKSKMLLRHACELSHLSQQFFNQWIDLTEQEKKPD
ncbi:hypothetical protein FEM33_17590 [Dyadobacter flavalbus]|uniref:Uncharacterized protein n=1 Tax=Dyadobacter flavalbus TaxID=2579942 RepID=A0A5M8QTY3_9BACT|nr:hypothetical protein [Dyadobacter flavalbus]KAA6438500.1 hypothetical protein FEM33_17590 [Dyadobacter flavalbus]